MVPGCVAAARASLYGGAMSPRILVVDDEPHIVDVVRAYLLRDGHEVLTAADGLRALEIARIAGPDLLVLDVMLPGATGFDVLRSLRGQGSRVPVIMLTARDDLVDRVAGLELGADDYVVKPFEPRELVARIGAVLRRLDRASAPTAPGPASSAPIASAAPSTEAGADAATRLFDLRIDPDAREAGRGPEAIDLTRTEFDLLLALAERPGRVWTREQIGARVFGESFSAYDRTIDSHVKNLRRKLGPRPDGGEYIETVRGVGYRSARQETAS
jgi:DNA-binding response OmpR family regulator